MTEVSGTYFLEVDCERRCQVEFDLSEVHGRFTHRQMAVHAQEAHRVAHEHFEKTFAYRDRVLVRAQVLAPEGEEKKPLPKVYIFCNSNVGLLEGLHLMAVAEDGEVLGQHVCSSMRWAQQDLHDAKWRTPAYEKKFGGYGNGRFYQLVFVLEGEPLPEGLNEKITAWTIADMKRQEEERREEEAQARDEKAREGFQ